MTKVKVKRRLKPWVIITLSIIFLTCVIYSSCQVITWKQHVDENEKILESIEDKIIIIEPEIEEKEQDTEYQIDFKSLKEQNSDTISYVKVNGTNIDYIVVKGKDNSYYLKHNFEKKWNVAGWIFADYHNKFDESDKNIIIFGHNTRDGSMLGTLKNTLNENWYKNKENHKIVLVTEYGTYFYQVFSTYSIKTEDYYINTEFDNNDEFDKFVKELKSRSVYDYGIEVSGEDKVLTLSSCIGDGSKRVVLHAKLIEM